MQGFFKIFKIDVCKIREWKIFKYIQLNRLLIE